VLLPKVGALPLEATSRSGSPPRHHSGRVDRVANRPPLDAPESVTERIGRSLALGAVLVAVRIGGRLAGDADAGLEALTAEGSAIDRGAAAD
jgi:hypothetical protein